MKKIVEGRKLTEEERLNLKKFKKQSDHWNEEIMKDARSLGYSKLMFGFIVLVGILVYVCYQILK